MKIDIFCRSAFNYDRDAASDEAGLLCQDVSLAKQEFAEECDINTIIRRFRVGGELPTGVRVPTYGDFEGIGSFHEAVNAIALANESFDAMPAEVRARFQNDPGKFVDFCADPANVDEMAKMGLAVKKPPVVVLPAGNVAGVQGDGNGNGKVGGAEPGRSDDAPVVS